MPRCGAAILIPTVLTGTRIVAASTAGCKLDSNLSTGGGTDDTAALQALLDTASTLAHLEVLIDGVALVTGLNVSSNTTIRGVSPGGCGFFLKAGSNRTILRNKHPNVSGQTDSNISLADLQFSGNGANQPGSQGDGHGGQADWFINLCGFYGVSNVHIRNCFLYNPVAYANNFGGAEQYGFIFSNCADIYIADCRVNMGTGPGRDGFHFIGANSRIRIRNLSGTTGSDFIALNARDYVTLEGYSTYVLTHGNISDVLIDGLHLQGSAGGVGMLAGDQSITNVTVRNVWGSVFVYAISMWNAWNTPYGGGLLDGVLIDGVNVTTTQDSNSRNCAIISGNYDGNGACVMGNVTIRNVTWNNANNAPLFLLNGVFDSLTIDGISINEHTENTHNRLIFAGSPSIGTFTIANLSWTRPSTATPTGAVMGSGSLFASRLNASNWTTNLVADPGVYGGTTITGNAVVASHNVAPAALAGTKSGTGATVSISGTDLGCLLTLNTGTGTLTNGNVAVINYGRAWGVVNAVTLTPANANAVGAPVFATNVANYQSKLAVGGTALLASTTYQWFVKTEPG